jgi:hypothetical protein
MTQIHCSQALIVLNAPPDLEEPVVDWLLARSDSTGFTSFPVFGHSTSHDGLSPAEQVSGRQRRQQFQVQIDASDVDVFLGDIQATFGAAGIHYWVLPLSQGGHLASR